jgi:hypothetical protein
MNDNDAMWTFGADGELSRRRAHNSRTRTIARSARRAELVCGKAHDRLLAVVLGVNSDLQVCDDDNDVTALGVDLTITCRCGKDHEIDGARFRAAVLNSPSPRRGRPPTIEVTELAT